MLSPHIFSDDALEAAVRKFKVFPAPAPLWKFLVEWGEEHRSRELPKDHRRRSLRLTDQERQDLPAAAEAARRAQTPIPNHPVQRLTEHHVRIAQVLALQYYWQNRPPRHGELAQAADTSVRTVRRALSALRALGLLPGIRDLVRAETPKRIPDFQPVLAVIADHTGRSVKTLYRYEREYARRLRRIGCVRLTSG